MPSMSIFSGIARNRVWHSTEPSYRGIDFFWSKITRRHQLSMCGSLLFADWLTRLPIQGC